jgi:ankyrin repeat protein
VAALAGEHFQMADLLLYNGTDMHAQGSYEKTPLHDAAFHENLKMAKKLIEYEADIHAEDWDGWTPLYWASGSTYFKDGSIIHFGPTKCNVSHKLV